MKHIISASVLFLLIACNGSLNSNSVKSTMIYTGKYRELCVEMEKEDLIKVEKLVKEYNLNLNFVDSANGVSLLNWCIFNQKEKSFEKLLDLGADVNMQDSGCHFAPPIIEAARLGATSKYLEAGLHHGGNANQFSKKLEGIDAQSVLLGAISSYSLNNVKLVIQNGADVNLTRDSFWTPLAETLVVEQIQMTKYLLEQGADYNDLKFWTKVVAIDENGKTVFDSTGSPVFVAGKKLTILDFLRELEFPLNSKEHQTKMEVVVFLKSRGLDYWKHPVPEKIKQAHKNDNKYLENY